MKNDIRIIKNELVGTSNNKILKQEKEIFFNELNDILKYALINEVQKRLKTEDKYSIFKDRFNIYYNLVTYELLKPLYIKYQKNNDFSSLEDKSFSRFKIPEFSDLKIYCYEFLDNIFLEVLENNKEENKILIECLENKIYNLLSAGINKANLLEYQKNVGTLEVRELVYNIIKENYDCTYELFNTCFNKTLIKINRLINSDVRILKYKQKQAKIKNIKSWGIVGLIHIINKNMK